MLLPYSVIVPLPALISPLVVLPGAAVDRSRVDGTGVVDAHRQEPIVQVHVAAPGQAAQGARTDAQAEDPAAV